ncbi:MULTISPECIES: VapE domain-containing protein [unclassified Ruegeria]|uniref:VapE domain-containing protein n=1 Tax=unclassified Ruegeria TaxID=2625375 RepID=UPI0014884AF2|nr:MULTISPECIES: VapE domain-containing protein [unclassified Ruegeria]
MTPNITHPTGFHRWALNVGFTGTIPVIPYGAKLHEESRVDPDARGKVPGDFYQGAWNGLGAWPNFKMSTVMADRFDRLGANVGVIQGEDLASFDADTLDPELAAAVMAHMHAVGGAAWPMRTGQAPKQLWMFRVQGDPIKSAQQTFTKDGHPPQGLEIKGTGSQVVIAGTHSSGVPYTWTNWPENGVAGFPIATADGLHALFDDVAKIIEGKGWKKGRRTRNNNDDGTGSRLGAEPFDKSLVPEVMNCIKNDELSYDDWRRIAFALKAAVGDNGRLMFEQWSARAEKNDPKETLKLWAEIEPDNSTGFGTLRYWATRDCGGRLPGDLETRVHNSARLKEAEVAGMLMHGQIIMPPGVEVAEAPMQLPPALQSNRPSFDYALTATGDVIRNSKANLVAFFHNYDAWHDCFAFDAFAQRIIMTKPYPGAVDRTVGRAITGKDLKRIRTEVLKDHFFPRIGQKDVDDAVMQRAEDNVYEPVQEYLNGLVWDGVPRLDGWLVAYGGVDPSGGAYVAQVGRKWLIGAVARAMKPGCKMDNALIFEGPQGVGKSSLLAALVPNEEWFSDDLPGLDNEKMGVRLAGKWIVELAELTKVLKSELEDMRHFVTRRYDEHKVAYQDMNERLPRRCVLAGSTNRDDYLKDHEGERRFWIVTCDLPLDVDGLIRDRDQLWAEALAAYRSGEGWWLDKALEDEAREIQKQRVDEDEWFPLVSNYVEGKDAVCIPEIKSIIGMEEIRRCANQRPAPLKRIRTMLQGLGFRKSNLKKKDEPFRKNPLYVRKKP